MGFLQENLIQQNSTRQSGRVGASIGLYTDNDFSKNCLFLTSKVNLKFNRHSAGKLNQFRTAQANLHVTVCYSQFCIKDV